MSRSPAPPRVLVIAGSDSGGGAGIQADIKTLSALGSYAMTAVTAITVQNTLGVSDVHAVPPAVVAAQIHACLDDIGADAIKLGMLGSTPLIERIVEALGAYPDIPIVADPVMVAKGGATLLPTDAVDALATRLLPLAAVVTPNAEEARVLLGGDSGPIEPGMKQLDAAKRLAERFGTPVLLKGGHLLGAAVEDVLVQPGRAVERFVTPRLDTRDTHGTGCTLASAIAAGLASGLRLSEAVAHASAFVHAAIAGAPGFGQGHGPLNHLNTRFRLASHG